MSLIKKVLKKFDEGGVYAVLYAGGSNVYGRLLSSVLLLIPPIVFRVVNICHDFMCLPSIPPEFSKLPRSQHGMYKLISDYEFNTVLDVGSGAGEHSQIFHNQLCYGESQVCCGSVLRHMAR